VKKSENLRKCRKIADIAREGRFLIGNLAIFGLFFRFFSFLRYFFDFCDFLRFFAIFVIFLRFCNFLRFRRCEAEARRRLAAALMSLQMIFITIIQYEDSFQLTGSKYEAMSSCFIFSNILFRSSLYKSVVHLEI
jgi:hypothetical protein